MILVTGGTGLVGSHLLYALIKAGHSVRATHRSESSFDAVKKVFSYHEDGASLYQKIEWQEANLLDIMRLKDAFTDVKTVYHCAAYISFDPKKENLLRQTNINGTANVVNLALAQHIDKLCYVSSIATLGQANAQGIIDEESEWNPDENHSVYSIAKYGAEMEVWRGSQEGLKCIVVNPGVILGEGHWDSASGSIITMAFKGIPFITKGVLGVVDVLDVVDVMQRLMESQIQTQRFVLVGHNCSYKDFFDQLSLALGKKPPTRFISKFWLRVLCNLDALSGFLFNTKRKLVSSHVRSMFSQNHFDSGTIEDALTFSFRPLDQTVKRVSNRFLNDCS